jgi:hypothetical protein
VERYFKTECVLRGVAICDAAKGDTIGFWDDLIDGSIHSLVYTNSMHFAKDLNISLFQLRQSRDFLGCFRIPMSRPAYNEFLLLEDKLANLPQINPDDKDSWSLSWGVQSYSSKMFYQHQFMELQPERAMLWIWDSKCIPKIKFFSWLLLNDKLNTRNILKRRKEVLDEGYNCALCHSGCEETMEHLFFDCPSAVSRWFTLSISWDDDSNVFHKIYIARNIFSRPYFMEVFMIASWVLWKERTDFIFNQKLPSLAGWKVSFKAEVYDHLIRIKSDYKHSIISWLDTL